MRLENYLAEEYLEPNEEDDFRNFVKTIKSNCKKWLQATDYRPLYRGNRDMIKFGVKKVRKSRKAVDMDRANQQQLDKLFKKKFGWSPRSEGMFCVPDESIASTYGRLGLVFVPGNFKYIWSPEVQDLYGRLRTIHDKLGMEKGDLIPEEESQKLVDMFQDTKLSFALSFPYSEIMVKCDKYYYINNQVIKQQYGTDSAFFRTLR